MHNADRVFHFEIYYKCNVQSYIESSFVEIMKEALIHFENSFFTGVAYVSIPIVAITHS